MSFTARLTEKFPSSIFAPLGTEEFSATGIARYGCRNSFMAVYSGKYLTGAGGVVMLSNDFSRSGGK
jgi:hypothetical protein